MSTARVARARAGNSIGDNEAPSTAGDVPVGGIVTAIAAGGSHTCALGYGDVINIGDDEAPSVAGNVQVF